MSVTSTEPEAPLHSAVVVVVVVGPQAHTPPIILLPHVPCELRWPIPIRSGGLAVCR